MAETTLWERTKAQATNNKIIVVLMAVVAMGTYAANGLDLWDKFSTRISPPTPDLVIAPLSEANFPAPLDGYKPINRVVAEAAKSKPVGIYTRGARVNIEVTHNLETDAAIIVRGLELKIENYYPGKREEYASALQGDEVIGSGPTKPFVFHVALFGDKVGRAMRITDVGRGIGAKARSENFFDVENPDYIKLTKADSSDSIVVEVTAETAGLYIISFELKYSVSGKVKTVSTMPPIAIYYAGE